MIAPIAMPTFAPVERVDEFVGLLLLDDVVIGCRAVQVKLLPRDAFAACSSSLVQSSVEVELM